GMELEDNPLLKNLAKDKEIEILFEDNELLVINKPAELLSVDGKEIKDSVYSRLAKKYPKSANYLIVHRLDMATSGIMLIAKTKKANKLLQAQFINRTIKKKYIALLDGLISKNNGEIDLPLRVDLEDSPRQLVCFEHGRPSKTLWRVLERKDNKTKIEFTPITGRRHQLRVHAAHVLGLNTAIVGDDFYGTKSNRLHLHAAYIKFTHPISKKVMEFNLEVGF
ncbi:MAG TPA: RluA family pseudouridine synthase, partial [Flavobacteriaceae bacterium]|nr:RluA family pseudouridine synthase [Flavobacteriaceae bacterium]